jgi:integrase
MVGYDPLTGSLPERFLSYTGLRWGEMAALRVGRLDLMRRRAEIVESVTLDAAARAAAGVYPLCTEADVVNFGAVRTGR